MRSKSKTYVFMEKYGKLSLNCSLILLSFLPREMKDYMHIKVGSVFFLLLNLSFRKYSTRAIGHVVPS